MEPTIGRGEVITIDTDAYSHSSPHRWGVVAFESPLNRNDICAFRIVGLPGESVDIQHGKLLINGNIKTLPPHLAIGPYQRPLSHLKLFGTKPVTYPYKLTANCYFVLGDNVSNALDSRYWGVLQRKKILGKVIGK